MKSIYIIGSLRNPEIPNLANDLEEIGLDVFADWHGGGPECDDYWKKYEQARHRTYAQAIKGYMAKHVFEFDKSHLDRTDGVVMLMPAGKSGHLELGYTIGKGKPGFILYPSEPDERWEIMTQFATEIFFDREKFLDTIAEKYAS